MADQSSMNPIDVSRLGQINYAGGSIANDNAMFLKVFSGEVLQTFEEANLMMPLHTVRTISSGREAQFPVMGTATASYHTPGESIMGSFVDDGDGVGEAGEGKYLSRIKHAERKIGIDGTLVSSAFIADIDEAKNHYDVRSAYTTQIGRELAYHADRALIHTVIGGARANNDRFGGSEARYLGEDITNDGGSGTYTADKLIETIASVAQKMDEKSVPSEGRYVILNPANYYTLVKSGNAAINTDFGGMGSVATGEVTQVSGIRVLKSNHVPSTDLTSDPVFTDSSIANNPNGANKYAANFAKTVGIAFQTEGVGTVKLLDLGLESEYQLDRLGTLMVAKYAMGHGILREECCYEIKTT
tara:strand:+ start:149 stop:1222 length:1074 start_codon:yes stop_codon:yes gene_type:complete